MIEQRVLVTGGTGDIGEMVVRKLRADGFYVDFTYGSNADKASKLLAELDDEQSDRTAKLQFDFRDLDAIDELISKVSHTDYYGLVHTAGVAHDALVSSFDMATAKESMAVNFWSYALLCRHLIRKMSRQKSGRIVAISSVAAQRGNRGNAIYAASKAAIEGFNRAFVQEYAGRGVTINTIAPGFVDTPMIADRANLGHTIADRVPAGRSATPEEIATTTAFLMSSEASYINGEVLRIDGGLAASLGID